MAKNDTIVVCDAGPIIHLDELNSLSLLDYNQVLIPKTVELEIRNHRDISFQKYKNFQIVQAQPHLHISQLLMLNIIAILTLKITPKILKKILALQL